MKNKLTRNALIKCLMSSVEAIPEHRSGNNLTYELSEAMSFAFSCFYLQQPSFLRHEENLQKRIYRKNLKRLFPRTLSCAQTCRNILDPVSPEFFENAYDRIFNRMDRSGTLRELRFTKECGLLLAGDGVDYFYSDTISCPNCSVSCHNKGTDEEWLSFSHKAFEVNIVHPTKNMVLPLQPEFIMPQDGNEKQDCERASAKRWMTKFRKKHHLVRATLLVDALHCNQPFFEAAMENGFHIIATCKEGSNPFLTEWVDYARKENDLSIVEKQIKKRGKFQKLRYEFLKNVPLRDTDDAIHVTYMSMTEIDPSSLEEVRYEYVTTHAINKENVEHGCLAGRKRWKTENEGNNTLKNHGYRFKHNYGHGKKHLSSVFATLIIFSYLVHTILELVGQDPLGKLLDLDPRKECFALMRHLLRAISFENWDALYASMLRALDAA